MALLALVSALAFNELNIHALETEAPHKVRDHATVRTADDESYLVPANNFYSTGQWKTNGNTTQDYVFRTPGYGIFYLTCKFLAGDYALYLLRYTQLLFYALSVLLLFRSLHLTSGQSIAIWLSAAYCVLPITSGFVYYTLTEGISPFLVSLFVYFLARYYKKEKGRNLLYASLALACLLLVRPIFLFFSLFFVMEMFLPFYPRKKHEGFLWPLIFMLISFVPLSIWQVRNFAITGRLISLHPVYLDDNRNIFRPSHQAMGSFFKCFTADGKVFHTCINDLWEHATWKDTQYIQVKNTMEAIPAWVKKDIDSLELAKALCAYQYNSFWVKKYIGLKENFSRLSLIHEAEHVITFRHFGRTLSTNHPFYVYVVMPFRSVNQMVFHSNLSLHVFQHSWRGHWAMEALRWICFVLHVLLFAALPLLFLVKKDRLTWGLLTLVLSYILYLAFFQVMNEERYLLPVFPMMVVCLGALIKGVGEWFKTQRTKHIRP